MPGWPTQHIAQVVGSFTTICVLDALVSHGVTQENKTDEIYNLTKGATVCLVTGKGGVGKTTVARYIAQLAAQSSPNVLLVRLDDFTNLVQSVGEGSGMGEGQSADRSEEEKKFASQPVADAFKTMKLEPHEVLVDYLADHSLGQVASRLISTGIIGVVATAIPGIKDLLLLGKLKQLEQTGDYDLIVVDLPASGHALSFLTSPAGLAEVARVGPLKAQADEVLEMLKDPTRVSCVLVTIAEETPVQEAIELNEAISDKTTLYVASLVVNKVLAPIVVGDAELESSPADARAAWAYRQSKFQSQMHQIERLMEEFDQTIFSITALQDDRLKVPIADQSAIWSMTTLRK